MLFTKNSLSKRLIILFKNKEMIYRKSMLRILATINKEHTERWKTYSSFEIQIESHCSIEYVICPNNGVVGWLAITVALLSMISLV